MKKNHFLLTFFLISCVIYSQSYESITAKYENLPKEDLKGMRYVKQIIKKAKSEKSYLHLTIGYNDAVFFSRNVNDKLKYADSAIWAAKLSKENDQIIRAYLGKGIIYYFNLKKYKPALDEYLKAYKYSKITDNKYEYFRVIYHMGVVKSYLGYYSEALVHFNNSINYFEKRIKESVDANEAYNNKKGYLNSLHQAVVCYQNLGDLKKVDSLIKIGLSISNSSKDFELENSYLLKSRGILSYKKKKYSESINDFEISLPKIIDKKDFAWESVGYFYKGKAYLAIGDKENAIKKFQKVDSLFQKYNFILPELRENYELLINNAKQNENTKNELYYTKSLLKADSIINKDFVYLSSKIHKEYDTQKLVEIQDDLENKNSWGKIVLFGLSCIIIFLVISLYHRNKREKELHLKYIDLQNKLKERKSIGNFKSFDKTSVNKSTLSESIINDILMKLEKFEKKHGYIEKNLTLIKLAKKLNTNANYLSQIINEKRGMTFNKYLGELRINYITNKLYNDKKYLNYTVEGLAEECGIASRQNFSDLFYNINGLRPADYIKLRKKEIEKITIVETTS